MKLSLKTLLTKIAGIAPVALHEVRLSPDGNMRMSYATPDIVEIYGLTSEELAKDASRLWSRIHPDDHAHIREAMAESARTLKPFIHEWRILHPQKGEIWVECRSTPERTPDGGTV